MSPPSNLEKINIIIQMIGIILAAAWGVYTFIYEKIIIPQSAPVNISLDLELQKINDVYSKKEKQLTAIEMKISETNPSSRPIYLLTNYWGVYGCKVKSINNDNKSLLVNANKALEDYKAMVIAQKHSETECLLVAIGKFSFDNILNPNEIIARTIVFYIPINEYDKIQAYSYVVSSEKEDFLLEPVILKDDFNVEKIFYSLTEDGKKDKLIDEEDVDFQESLKRTELSLWR